jgi:hypothetical protein
VKPWLVMIARTPLRISFAGGFLLLYACPKAQAEITRAPSELRPFAFKLEPLGTKIFYVEEGN